ncbi:AraC family transcriptional regulator [Pseudaquabacterium terrae]|nr:helix-turn-helix transcriptional regulator [Aquabacterium terrae]
MNRVPAEIGPLTPHLYVPTPLRPVRAKVHHLSTDQRVVPHQHPWAQLAFSTTGVIRLTVDHGTYLVPASRALWVPAGVEHAVTVIEDATLMTLYLHQPRSRSGPAGVPRADQAAWRTCRVLEVSDLLRSLVLAMDTAADGAALDDEALKRERLLATLVQDELRRARALRLGVALPRDKRLRALCEAVLDDPARHRRLEDWARDSGASARTVARLFREQLGVSFGQWRQQVFLARALSLATQGRPMAQIAGALGYASPSAFTAMVRRTVGQPPRRFFAAAA